MLKIVFHDYPIEIIIYSPKQCSNSRTKIKHIGEKIKHLNEQENAIIVFDDILGTSNGRYIDQSFIRGRNKNLDIYCLSQSFFDLPKTTIRKNSNKIVPFNQTLKDIENIFRDVGGYDMNYDEFKQLRRKSWEKNYNYLCFDRFKKRDHGKYCIYSGSRKHIYRMHSRNETFLINLNFVFI